MQQFVTHMLYFTLWTNSSLLLLFFFVTANNDRILLSDKMAVACVRYCGLSRFVSFSDFMDKQMWTCTLGTQSRFHEEPLIHQVI